MVFTKSFPQDVKGQTVWTKIVLSPYEEKFVEKSAREEHISLLLEAMRDAKEVIVKSHQEINQQLVTSLALSLFSKRVSHVAYMKEEKCRELFEKRFKSSVLERLKG